jgi:HAE1 family hydrophobic/amphiphilic exporter-1
MILSKFSIKRPVAMTALIIVLILAGLNSYRRIGLNNMPDIDAPFVTITTIYPGASPAEIEVGIAKK